MSNTLPLYFNPLPACAPPNRGCMCCCPYFSKCRYSLLSSLALSMNASFTLLSDRSAWLMLACSSAKLLRSCDATFC